MPGLLYRQTVRTSPPPAREQFDHQMERSAGVGDVVDQQDALARQGRPVERRRQHHRGVEGRADPRVELDVEAAEGLHVERVAQGARQGEPAAGDPDDRVGPESVGRDGLRQLARRATEQLVAEDLALVVHATTLAEPRMPATGDRHR